MATTSGSVKRDGVAIRGSATLADLGVWGVVPGYGPLGTENDIALVKDRAGTPCFAMGVRVLTDGTLTVRLTGDVSATGRKVFRTFKVYADQDNLMEFDAIQKTGSTPDLVNTEGSIIVLL